MGAGLVLCASVARQLASTGTPPAASRSFILEPRRVRELVSGAPSQLSRNRAVVDTAGGVAARLDSVLELLVDGDEGAAATLAAMAVGDSSSLVREEAVAALGDVGGSIASQALIQALSDPDARVKEAAVRALAHLASDDAVRALSIALSDPEPSLRGAAVDALADIGSHAAVEALRVAARDESSAVREAAGSYLAELTR
ncbi:MAG TPA: HEAT repeat domain-containing protein [Steroidobacteraceae bacterium]|nr:HEAT repeat domain-containing protein [Steroidobacteraceae bacterium]